MLRWLAKSLISWDRHLRADAVRCTSVDGYGLPAGADSDEQLRAGAPLDRVHRNSVASMASACVLSELVPDGLRRSRSCHFLLREWDRRHSGGHS